MQLMELLNAEPFIAVNTGLSTVEEVAAQVEYCNGAIDTPMGALRARNGHARPFAVTYWAVGNEMYGSWQLGHMPLADYVKKHNAVADAMWRVDPSLQLVAVGNVGRWSETMLSECADFMSYLSEHIYAQERPGLLGHTSWLAEMIRARAETHRNYRSRIPGLADKNITIAMDEWNYWYGSHIYGELGVRYFLKDALGVAIGLHEFFRNSDIYSMANYAQTVNVIGCIKTTRTDAAFASTGLVLKLYREHFGAVPIEITSSTEPLDIAASWSEDRRFITLAIVNPTKQKYELPLQSEGVSLRGDVQVRQIKGHDEMAYNEPGSDPPITVDEYRVKKIGSRIKIPPLSVTLYTLPVAHIH